METLGHAYADTRMRMHTQTHVYVCIPLTCERIHGHVFAYMGRRIHTRPPETMEGKFFALKLRFGMNPTSSGSCSKPPFSQYKKSNMVPFQNTLKILRENLTFTRNCESKREFFTKHPQVNIFLISVFSWI